MCEGLFLPDGGLEKGNGVDTAADQANSGPSGKEGSRAYQVVARRYRPRSFSELLGQQHIAQALGNAILAGRVGHAYLFTGARGVGKTSAARIFGKALNCMQGPSPQPCNQCDVCLSIDVGEDVDVLEIDGASNRGIDEIRQLRSNINIRPSRTPFKVYIIDEVHMLTQQAFNALLKTLEEPPEHVKFIFCTTDPEKLPITVLSRCQRFDFSPIVSGAIVDRLREICKLEGREVEEGALALLARRAAGSMRDSQSLLEQLLAFSGARVAVEDVHAMLGTADHSTLEVLVSCLIERDSAGALAACDQAMQQGIEAGQLVEQLLAYWRDLLVAAVQGDAELALQVDPEDWPKMRERATQLGAHTILAGAQILDQTLVRMRQSTHARILLEMALVRVAQLENLDELALLIQQFRQGGSGPASIRPAASGTRPPSAAPASATSSGARQPSSARSAPRGTSPPRGESGGSGEKKTAESVDLPQDTPRPRGSSQESPPKPVSGNGPATGLNSASTESDDRHPEHHEDQSRDRSSFSSRAPEVRSEEAPQQSSISASDLGEKDDHEEGRSTSGLKLSARNVAEIWQQALGSLEDMTADFASCADEVAISAPNRLVVRFAAAYNLQKEGCERPDRKGRIEQALSEIVGERVTIELQLTGEVAELPRKKPATSSRHRQRESEKHELVQQAMALFDAEIIRVDAARAANGSAHGSSRNGQR